MLSNQRDPLSLPNASTAPRSLSEAEVRLARAAIEVDTCAQYIATHKLTQPDVALVVPFRAHLDIGIRQLDDIAYEVEQHGVWHPDGRPVVPIASQLLEARVLERAA